MIVLFTEFESTVIIIVAVLAFVFWKLWKYPT